MGGGLAAAFAALKAAKAGADATANCLFLCLVSVGQFSDTSIVVVDRHRGARKWPGDNDDDE